MVLFSFFLALSPQGPRQACDDESNASYVLTLPGSVMDLTALLNNKKFHGRGNKEGAIRVFQLLQQDKLGQLEARRGRNSKVSISKYAFHFPESISSNVVTSGNRNPGSKFYSGHLDTLADSVCIHQLVLKRHSAYGVPINAQ